MYCVLCKCIVYCVLRIAYKVTHFECCYVLCIAYCVLRIACATLSAVTYIEEEPTLSTADGTYIKPTRPSEAMAAGIVSRYKTGLRLETNR